MITIKSFKNPLFTILILAMVVTFTSLESNKKPEPICYDLFYEYDVYYHYKESQLISIDTIGVDTIAVLTNKKL